MKKKKFLSDAVFYDEYFKKFQIYSNLLDIKSKGVETEKLQESLFKFLLENRERFEKLLSDDDFQIKFTELQKLRLKLLNEN